MATKKKNPFETLPYNQPDTRQSIANVPPASAQPIPTAYKPQQLNSKTGKVEDINRNGTQTSFATALKTNFDIPLSHGDQLIADLKQKQADAALIASQTPPNVTAEQLANLTVLTPEQQALANSNPTLQGKYNFKGALVNAGERAVAGGVAVGGVGLAAGTIVPVIGNVAGAIGGGIIGGVGGATTAFFKGFKDVNADNVAGIDLNVDIAEAKINNAIIEANRGGKYEDIKLVIGESIAQLDLAERQYKEAGRNVYSQQSKTDQKRYALELYKKEILPDKIRRLNLALSKPDPTGINNGVDAQGNPI